MRQSIEQNKSSLQSNMTRLVRSNIKDRLGDFINVEVDCVEEITPQTWKIVAHNITKTIKESPAMVSLLDDIQSSVTSSVEYFISNIENEPISEYQKNKTLRRPINEVWLQASSDLGLIAQDISQHKPLRVRTQALNTFLKCVLSEVVTNQHWPLICRNLKENLCTENIEVFDLTLKIHAKLIQSASHVCVREGFINLVEGLYKYYSNFHITSLPDFRNGIDTKIVTHNHLTQISHLIIDTAKQMPKNWLRYGERRVEEIVGAFVNLLSMHIYCNKTSQHKDILYPYHIISALDPKAIWCKQWVHGAFGQYLLLGMFSQNVDLIKSITEEVLLYLDHENKYKEVIHETRLSGGTLKFAIFAHSLNILSKLLSFDKGRNFFPITIKGIDEPITLDSILIKLITYLNLKHDYDLQTSEMEIITNFIINFLQTEFEEISDTFIAFLLEPIQHGLQKLTLNIPSYTIDILLALTNNSMKISYLLGSRHRSKLSYSRLGRNPNNTNISATSIRRNRSTSMSLDRQYSAKSIKIPNKSISDPSNPAKMIEQVTSSLLQNKNISEMKTLLPLIEICGNIFVVHEGLSMLDAYNSHLVHSAVNLYKQLSCEKESIVHCSSKAVQYDIQSESLYRYLVKFLTSVAATPCGLYSLMQQDIILQELLVTMFQTSHIPWESPEFRHMVSMMTSVSQTAPVLYEESSKLLTKPLNSLQYVFEDPIALMTGSDKRQVECIRYYINIIFAFVPNLQGVMALLKEPEGSSEGTLVDGDPVPTSLSELMTFENSMEPWHYIALLTLRALTTNIDVCLHLNSVFRFQEKLLKLQSENVTSHSEDDSKEVGDSKLKSNPSNKTIIIDECSLLRHQILIATYAVGGASERRIPPTVVNAEQLDDGELKLFCDWPPPQFATGRSTARNTRLKGQSDLQKFLQDTKQGLHDANWLSHARRAYKSSRNDDVKANVILDLLDQVPKLNSNSISLFNEDNSDLDNGTLYPEENHGIQLTLRYGVRCHLLLENSQNGDNLTQLILFPHSILKKKSDSFDGFDWFIATIFLLCGGNMDRCRNCMENFSSLTVTPFMWRTLASAQDSMSQKLFMFGHLLELLVKIELPVAFSALQLSGISWWLICKQWMGQCFWNVLDWPQICHWLVIGILNQPDYMLYFCVSLLRHMQPQILQAVSEGNVWEKIMVNKREN
ncbi:hypothetical protein C0J52_02542 [Blattella germanica]|nr:hypothetical protein C0J52_02542 [Blattella germanica]